MANSTSYTVVATTEEDRADSESPSSSSRPGDASVFAKAQALIPQESPQEYGSEGLTWEDDYYNDNEDIVAVVDVNGKTVSDLYYSIAIKYYPAVFLCFVLCVLYFSLFLLLDDEPEWYYGVLGVAFFVPYSIGIWLIVRARSLAKRAQSAKIHLAVTSDCIQYDQESPDAHVMVS
jgi:hypothetical protein